MSNAVAAAVDRLLAGRKGVQPVAPLTETDPGLSIQQAYAIQGALEQALIAQGERVIGWKAGFTSPALQESYGVHEPVGGFMLASGVFASGDAVPLARFKSVGVEVEVAFLLKADLVGPGVTPASVLLAVEGAMPALELIDFRLSGKPGVRT